MADENPPRQLSDQSRKFLEKLLADCRAANVPGGQQLINMIEETLAGKPLSQPKPYGWEVLESRRDQHKRPPPADRRIHNDGPHNASDGRNDGTSGSGDGRSRVTGDGQASASKPSKAAEAARTQEAGAASDDDDDDDGERWDRHGRRSSTRTRSDETRKAARTMQARGREC